MFKIDFLYSGRKIVFAIILWGAGICTQGQISHGGQPYSFQSKMLKSSFAVETLPPLSNQALLEEEIVAGKREKIYQFGKEVSVDYRLDNSGTWEDLPNGGRLWRLGIKSKEAYSLNLIFDHFQIPSASNFFIYTADCSYVLGSFTAANNNKWGNFSTTLLPGDAIVLEFFEAPQDKGMGIINLTTVVHGYKDFFFKTDKTEKASGSCNININCEKGLPYSVVKHAVVKVVGGGGMFSGTLVNNTAQDTTPYFLTAFHCADRDRNLVLSQSEINIIKSWVFIFNYESSDCEGKDKEQTYSINGSTLLAQGVHSDFLLVLLNDKPTEECEPYYAGWNLKNPLIGAVCIHHPSGDIKKISIDDKALSSGKFWDEYPNFPDNTHFVTIWDKGTTEGGSSGSGLFNKYGEIIGQLQGGYAACNKPNGEDYFGKVAYSWTNNNSPDNNRLDYWLDPLKSGAVELYGLDPYGTLGVSIPPYPPSEIAIHTFPNPSASYLYIIDDSSQLKNITAYDLFGREVITITDIENNEFALYIEQLDAGMYILKISTDRGIFVKKFIKE